MRLLLAVPALLLGAAAVPAYADATVEVRQADFAPRTVTIDVGDTVTWTRASTNSHTITSDAAGFDEDFDATDTSFAWTFDRAGSFGYYCRIHEASGMTGTVVVRGAAPTASPPTSPSPRPSASSVRSARPVATSAAPTPRASTPPPQPVAPSRSVVAGSSSPARTSPTASVRPTDVPTGTPATRLEDLSQTRAAPEPSSTAAVGLALGIAALGFAGAFLAWRRLR